MKVTDLTGNTLNPVYTDQVNQVGDGPYRQTAAILFGFGSEVNRNLSTISPSDPLGATVSRSFSRNIDINLDGTPTVPYALIPEQTRQTLEHPKGVKYGLMNYDHIRPKAIYRRNKFGQFADLLEGRKLGVCYNRSKTDLKNSEGITFKGMTVGDRTITVDVVFVDPARRIIKNDGGLQLLFSQNLDRFQRSRVPFFDDDEGRVRRSKAILNPQVSIFDSEGDDPFAGFV